MAERPARTRLAAGTHPADGAGSLADLESVVCFVVSGRRYALDAAVVCDVVSLERGACPSPRRARSPRIAQAGAPAAAPVGALTVHDATVALIDAAILLGHAATRPRTTALVLVSADRTIGALAVDRVMAVARFVATRLTPAALGGEPPHVAGFMPDGLGGTLSVLDAPSIVRSLVRLAAR